jgi:hypothetical protein
LNRAWWNVGNGDLREERVRIDGHAGQRDGLDGAIFVGRLRGAAVRLAAPGGEGAVVGVEEPPLLIAAPLGLSESGLCSDAWRAVSQAAASTGYAGRSGA